MPSFRMILRMGEGDQKRPENRYSFRVIFVSDSFSRFVRRVLNTGPTPRIPRGQEHRHHDYQTDDSRR